MIESGKTYYFNNAVAFVVQQSKIIAPGWVTWTEDGKERHTPKWYFEKYAKLKPQD